MLRSASPAGLSPLPALPVALLVAMAFVPAAAAFGSLPGGPHEDVTAAAVREAGLPEDLVGPLSKAVVAVDFRESRLEPGEDGIDRIDATADYRPEHHCDRVPPAGDAESFEATVDYVADRRAAALAAAQAQDADTAVQRLGEMLHALQDCFSHSNAVDLDDPSAVVAAVNGHAVPPAGLRLTGFQPGADDPERPAGDGYAHRDFAKDAADKNDESKVPVAEHETKFEAARTLAIEASIMALQDIVRQLEPEQIEALAEADGGGQPVPRVGVPGVPPALLLAGLVAAVAVATRRR